MVRRAVFLDRDGVISANVQRDGRSVAPTSMAETANETIIAAQASPPEIDFVNRRPRLAFTRKPTTGNSGISDSISQACRRIVESAVTISAR